MTAPYMHDGSITSLHDVIDHYQNGLSHHANQSPLLKSFSLSEEEKADLVSFLEALTGDAALTQCIEKYKCHRVTVIFLTRQYLLPSMVHNKRIVIIIFCVRHN